MLLHQVFSFNSPVWFNVGTASPQQVSACFILSVDDTMDSILNWYREEGLIFKGGSGAGLNLSRIRSSKELLSSGGTASGPVSFMRGADASAGTIKSGGATRRAAKMVVLDVDHPDIAEFVETKAQGGEQDPGAARRRLRHGPRRRRHHLRAVPERQQLGARLRRVHARGRLAGGRVRAARPADRRGHRDRRRQASFSARSPRRRGSAPTPASSTTTPSTTGTPARSPGRITASNPCSEYMHLDNSSCNLASLNLMKFLRDDGTFDAATFAKAVEFVITAMDISICFADFPTAADRRDHPGLPAARHRLRQPRRAADGHRPRLRLRRRPRRWPRRSPR